MHQVLALSMLVILHFWPPAGGGGSPQSWRAGLVRRVPGPGPGTAQHGHHLRPGAWVHPWPHPGGQGGEEGDLPAGLRPHPHQLAHPHPRLVRSASPPSPHKAKNLSHLLMNILMDREVGSGSAPQGRRCWWAAPSPAWPTSPSPPPSSSWARSPIPTTGQARKHAQCLFGKHDHFTWPWWHKSLTIIPLDHFCLWKGDKLYNGCRMQYLTFLF